MKTAIPFLISTLVFSSVALAESGGVMAGSLLIEESQRRETPPISILVSDHIGPDTFKGTQLVEKKRLTTELVFNCNLEVAAETHFGHDIAGRNEISGKREFNYYETAIPGYRYGEISIGNEIVHRFLNVEDCLLTEEKLREALSIGKVKMSFDSGNVSLELIPRKKK